MQRFCFTFATLSHIIIRNGGRTLGLRSVSPVSRANGPPCHCDGYPSAIVEQPGPRTCFAFRSDRSAGTPDSATGDGRSSSDSQAGDAAAEDGSAQRRVAVCRLRPAPRQSDACAQGPTARRRARRTIQFAPGTRQAALTAGPRFAHDGTCVWLVRMMHS